MRWKGTGSEAEGTSKSWKARLPTFHYVESHLEGTESCPAPTALPSLRRAFAGSSLSLLCLPLLYLAALVFPSSLFSCPLSCFQKEDGGFRICSVSPNKHHGLTPPTGPHFLTLPQAGFLDGGAVCSLSTEKALYLPHSPIYIFD